MWREKNKKKKQRKETAGGQIDKHGKPQTGLTGLIDGDGPGEDGSQLLKASVANKLLWVCCVKSTSTVGKVATVIGNPHWPVDVRQVGGRESILPSLTGGGT